jgi:hypothetical protein
VSAEQPIERRVVQAIALGDLAAAANRDAVVEQLPPVSGLQPRFIL